MDAEFYTRLVRAGASIKSLNSLKGWAKDRYPDHYTNDWRMTTGMPYGREAMQRLWADYPATEE